MRTAEEALREHGFDGDRLLGVARAVAEHATRRLPHASRALREDLAAFLVEQGLKLAVAYDPARSGDGYSFPSYLWDVMERRVPDFFRRKSEGFGDKRYGAHDRIVLAADPLDEVDVEAVDVDPFEPETAREAAVELADRLGLSPQDAWTLVELAARLADGCRTLTKAADETRVHRKDAVALLEDLRDELEARGYGEVQERLSV